MTLILPTVEVEEISAMFQIELNRLLTFEDVVQKYGGPTHVWEMLRPSLPVFQVHEGTSIYLESRVDEFLHALQLRWSVPNLGCENAPSAADAEGEFVTILDASKRFLGGQMSKEWWYKQATAGKLPSYKAGGAILLRLKDVSAFIAGLRHEDRGTPACDPQPEQPAPLPTRPRKKTGQQGSKVGASSGFRFFKGRVATGGELPDHG
jgi:hypothetical protein